MKKDNIIAGVLSFFIPGLGQLYQSRNKDAIWFFAVWLITALLCITVPITVCIWVWSVYDALVWEEENGEQ